MARASSRRKRAVIDSSPELEEGSADEFSLDEGNSGANVDDESEDDIEGIDENAEEDEQEEDEEEEEEDFVSDGEEAYQLEDPDDVDEELELHDEPLQPVSAPLPVNITDQRQKQTRGFPARKAQGSRKRQHTLFDEEKNDDSDEYDLNRDIGGSTLNASRNKTRRVDTPAQSIDNDLLLTDEEQEYDPHAHPDVMKMTERQRARYLGLDDTSAGPEANRADHTQKFLELDGSSLAAAQGRPGTKSKETEEEAALRKSELARRRHDYKLKQLEGEKQDTLNKLLKRRATKTREVQGSGPTGGDGDKRAGPGLDTDPGLGGDEGAGKYKPRRPRLHHAALFRYKSKVDGSSYTSTLSIPSLEML